MNILDIKAGVTDQTLGQLAYIVDGGESYRKASAATLEDLQAAIEHLIERQLPREEYDLDQANPAYRSTAGKRAVVANTRMYARLLIGTYKFRAKGKALPPVTRGVYDKALREKWAAPIEVPS